MMERRKEKKTQIGVGGGRAPIHPSIPTAVGAAAEGHHYVL
jgi:hypothetical protein